MRTFDHPETKLSVENDLTGATFPQESDSKRDDATGAGFGNELVYDLRLGEGDSGRFYADVAAFSQKTVAEIEFRAAAAIDGYSRYVTQKLCQPPRSRGEHALEFLTVGMALRLYGRVAARTPGWVIDVARELYWLRRRSPGMKPLADFLRAGLFQVFMRRNLRALPPPPHVHGAQTNHFAALPRLIEWFHSTGEFEQESRRLDDWRSYLREIPKIDAENWIRVSIGLFDWFTREADLALGSYTKGVIRFLEKTYAVRFWREDQIFCGRLPVEYHLGMVAAEVMNDGLRDEFLSKPNKVLLVPTCMRGSNRKDCKAVVHGLDMKCAACKPDCAVNRITRLMREQGVQVFMVPHATGFSRWLQRWQDDPKVGVAAVACLMNILPGGYEMRARRIASQCVPLDYPGCEKHWSSEDVPTGLNEERLVKIVNGSCD